MKDAVLALELSTVNGSVAVVAGREVLYEASSQAMRSHNAQVFGPLGEALEAAGSRLRGVVVGTGPGSYTGVRIAIAAAQGVGLSRDVPVVGMSSLLGCVDEPNFGVVGDARRGRFYVAQVRGGALDMDIALVRPEAVPAMIDHSDLKLWVTCDEHSPWPHVTPVRPLARRLAAQGGGLSFDRDQSESLEPIYLEGAFITQAKKQ